MVPCTKDNYSKLINDSILLMVPYSKDNDTKSINDSIQ